MLPENWATLRRASIGLPRVVNWLVLNYSSNFFTTRALVTFYLRFQISMSGCSRLTNCWNLWKLIGVSQFHLSTCQPGNRSEYYTSRVGVCSRTWPFGRKVCWPTTPSSSLAACIRVLPVLTSILVLVKVLGEYSSRKLLVSGSPRASIHPVVIGDKTRSCSARLSRATQARGTLIS